MPQRITPKLCEMVKHYHPIYMNLHFNHPDELTPEVKAACGRLADAGVPLGAQTVLLKGVNDSADTLQALAERLFDARVLPYYLHLLDRVRGSAHFEVCEDEARKIVGTLRARLPGYLVPRLVREEAGRDSKTPVA